MRLALWLMLFAVSSCAGPRPLCGHLGEDDREALLALARADQDARAAHVAWAQANPNATEIPDEILSPIEVADAASQQYLWRLIDRDVWPCISDVGPEATRAAWLLVQHADSQPELQEAALALMSERVIEGQVNQGDYALLRDRVRVNQGRPQIYGTQWRTEVIDGVLHFGLATPLANAATVDERRAAVGFVPLKDEEASVRRAYGIPDDAPGF